MNHGTYKEASSQSLSTMKRKSLSPCPSLHTPATPMHSSPTLIIPSATRIPIYQIRYQVEENDWMPIDYSPNVANCRKAYSGENIGTSDSGLYRSILQHVQAMERPLFIQRWQLGIEMTTLVFSRNNS